MLRCELVELGKSDTRDSFLWTLLRRCANVSPSGSGQALFDESLIDELEKKGFFKSFRTK